MDTNRFNRRDVFVLGAGGLALGAGYAQAATSQEPFALNQGFEDFTAYFRIISDFGGGTTYRYHAGRALIVPAPRQLAEDFVDFVSIKQDRSRRLANGDFQHAYKGVTLFTDLETGNVLETFNNRFTGETNQVKHFATSGGSIVYTPEGAYQLRPGSDPTKPTNITGDPVKFEWAVAGDDAWITYPERFAIYDDEGNVLGADNSMYRYLVSREQLNDPAISNIDAVMTWQTETGLWPWMNMGDHPGHLIFGSMGRKYASLDDLPQEYIQATEDLFPGQLTAAIEWDDFVLPNDRS